MTHSPADSTLDRAIALLDRLVAFDTESSRSNLPLIDFVAIHTYPILNDSRWNWQQVAVPAGQARAEAMMNASLVYAKDTYAAVAAYLYKDAAGNTVSTGASMPAPAAVTTTSVLSAGTSR